MTSERLRYQPVLPGDLDDFHRLVEDDHIRRYLMDGNRFPRDWSAERIGDSQSLFRRRGVGLWLAHETSSDQLAGFCGFLEMVDLHPEPQLVYALLPAFTGRGHATEMARACIAAARAQPGFATIHSSVDEANAASLRVLEKLGFRRVSTTQGSFGSLHMLRLDR
jgi:[ribosomal protein S5]-alanine N-acetyltransferase